MIISDLQYIESADNSEVQGGFSFRSRFTSAFASADSEAVAFGDRTFASTNTVTVADADNGVSASGSSSTASASSRRFFFGY